jgi:hypothetical protein
MKKLFESKVAAWVAITIIICVTTYLAFWCHVTSALAVYGVFLVMPIMEGLYKNRLVYWSPLITYLILIVEYAVKFSLEDKALREDEGEKLTNIVIYGSFMLITIPILYYNRSLK